MRTPPGLYLGRISEDVNFGPLACKNQIILTKRACPLQILQMLQLSAGTGKYKSKTRMQQQDSPSDRITVGGTTDKRGLTPAVGILSG